MSERPGSNRTNRLIIAALVIPCLLLSIPPVLAYRTERRMLDSFHWVSHTLEVQRQLERLLSLLSDAEGGLRGFLLTSRDVYLEPYNACLGRIPEQLGVIRDLTRDNSVQRENLQELEPLVSSKRAFMAQAVALQQSGDHEGAVRLLSTDQGKDMMKSIRTQLVRMSDEESRLLVIRQQTLASHARFSTRFVIVLVGLNFLFALAILYLLHRLTKLQRLVTICAWSRTVEYENEWISFEEYLHRRFNLNASHGISPAEAEKALLEVRNEELVRKDAVR